MKASVIIYGPQGCGKTANAEKLASHYGLNKIQDGWQPGEDAEKVDTLILTNVAPDDPRIVVRRRWVSFEDAMKEMMEPE